MRKIKVNTEKVNDNDFNVDMNRMQARIGIEASKLIGALINNFETLRKTTHTLMNALQDHFNNESKDKTLLSHRIDFIFKLIDTTDRKSESIIKALKGSGIIEEDLKDVFDATYYDAMEFERIVQINGDITTDVSVYQYNFPRI